MCLTYGGTFVHEVGQVHAEAGRFRESHKNVMK